MTFLALENVTKTYGRARALDGAALHVRSGEVHALMGENGAGKSTIIKILAGVVQPDTCQLLLDGQPATIRSAQDAFDHGFRFLHQELNVVPHLSVAENIVLGRRYPRRLGLVVDWKVLNARASDALAKLHVDHIDVSKKMARLSTGDQMLVKIASLLVSGGDRPARLYVMDEPTAALTGDETEKLFRVIAELKATGAAILYVTHRMNEVTQICDRVTVFRDGQHIKTKDIGDTNRSEIIQLMTGRDMADAYPPRRDGPGSAISVRCQGLATKHVSGLNFDLNDGEILGVAGLANSGQAELLHALLGVDRQNSGSFALAGQTKRIAGPPEAWASRIAYIPRERRREGLMLRRSIIDNIVLPHLNRFKGFMGLMSRRRERSHSEKLGQAVTLKAARLTQPVGQLSGGNQQKVVLARAISDAPQLLLMDEPTRGVDVGAKFDIYELIRRFSAKGATVIMTSSDLPELIGMCDRILIMRNHRQAEIITTAGLSSAGLLEKFYE